MNWYFVFFFVSGFCSLLYEIIWLRLAVSQFGVTAAMISIVLAVFMGGLGLGSWLSGYASRRYGSDPPPPVGAATSSLLYSKEFYALAKQCLRPGGILQQWLAGREAITEVSVARALTESFPYVRALVSVDRAGLPFLASVNPIAFSTASELAKRPPVDAAHDLIEWGPAATPEAQFQLMLDNETPIDKLVGDDPDVPALQDDRPINEFFLIRSLSQPGYLRGIPQPVFRRERLF